MSLPIELVINGEEFIDETIHLIQSAKKFILLQTYIFEYDELTSKIIDLLIEKSRKNIPVFILLDGFGSGDFPQEIIQKLTNAGVIFQFFSPFFGPKSEHIGRRLHSKIIIIDKEKALIGGINISKKFLSPVNASPWLDYSCIVGGEIVQDIINKNFPLYLKYFPQITSFIKKKKVQSSSVRVKINDWMRFKNEIYKSYIQAIKKSNHSIFIVAPYFLPGKKFLTELNKAATRGVHVHLFFSANSDHPFERLCSRYLYSWLLKSNIHIYEWEESIVHGKIAVIDNKWATIGSYNHNFLSHFINHEINLEIIDSSFSKIVLDEIKNIQSRSKKISHEMWQNENSLVDRMIEIMAYWLTNLLTVFIMLLVFRKKDKTDINLSR